MSTKDLIQVFQNPTFIQKFDAVNSGLSFQKETGFALQILNQNSYLAGSTQNSILSAVYNTALSGLSLNPVLSLAYLVPRKVKVNDKYELQATLVPSYRGLLKISTDAGSVKNAYAKLVYEFDYFEISEGTNPELIHKPDVFNPNRGKIIGAYAVAELIKGGKMFEVMNLAEINGIMARSESVKNGGAFSPWKSDFGEMAKKTVLKRLLKTLPLSEISDKTLQALNLEFENEQIEFEPSKKNSADVGYFEVKEPEQIAQTAPESEPKP